MIRLSCIANKKQKLANNEKQAASKIHPYKDNGNIKPSLASQLKIKPNNISI